MKRCVFLVFFCLLSLAISHVHAQPIDSDLTKSEKADDLRPIVSVLEEDFHPRVYKVEFRQRIFGQDKNPLFDVAVVLNDGSRIAQYLHSIGGSVDNNRSLDWLIKKLQELTKVVRENTVELRGVFESHIQELEAARQRFLSIKRELEVDGQDSTPIKQELEAIMQDLRSIRNSEWLLWENAAKKLKDSHFQIVNMIDARIATSFRSNYKLLNIDRLSLLMLSSRRNTLAPRETSTTPNIFLENLLSVRLAFNYLSILLKDITGLPFPAPFIIESVEHNNAYAFPDTSSRNILRKQLLNIAPDFEKKSKLQIDLHSIKNASPCRTMRLLPFPILNTNRNSTTLHEVAHSLGLYTMCAPHDDRPYTFFSGAEIALHSICSLLENDFSAIRTLCKSYFSPHLSSEDKEDIDFSVYESLNVSNAEKLIRYLKGMHSTVYESLELDDIDLDRVQLSSLAREDADYFIDNLDIQGTDGHLFENSSTIKKDDDSSPFGAIGSVKIDVPGLAQFIFNKFHNQCNEDQQQIQDLKQGFKVVCTTSGVQIQPAAEPNSFFEHLRDSFGEPSAPGMEIVQRDFSAPDKFTIIPNGGYAFFQGENVTQVLQGLPLSIFSGDRDLNPFHVVGAPVLGFENETPELSHIELRNCLMSHQIFNNYGIFTKLELAVFKDLGYPIDLENFWGFSIYGDGGTHTLDENYSFFARVQVLDQPGIYEYEIGTPNSTPLTVGLHVYGHDNTVQITAGYRVLQSGDGSVGIRVDGWGNILETMNGSQIISYGKNGIGMMVCYGKYHRIHQAGTITAGSIGACFSFGGNTLGMTCRQKGSFINTRLDSLNPNTFLNSDLEDELKGPLVEYYDVKGRLEGQQAAIYISKNAYVATIAMGTGSEIRGDIFTEWNSLTPFIQYETRHTLHTKIYFGAKRDESSNDFVADDSYNGIFIGSILDKCGALDVCLMGGILNWGRGDSQQMSDLRGFYMRRGARLRLLETSNFILISAKELIFEPDTTIIAPSRQFQMRIAVPEEDAKFDCDSVKQNVRFEYCNSEEQNPFDIDYLVEEPNAVHPKIRIIDFFQQLFYDLI
jgi:hypothetical protein